MPIASFSMIHPQAYLLLRSTQKYMADLQAELEKLLTSYEEKHKLYSSYLDTSKEHNATIIKLAETQPIDIKDFEDAEALYDNMVLREKTYRISKEVFDRNRQDVIAKLAPVQNIKIRFKFSYAAERGSKETNEYYIWLKYNPDNPDESQLVLQKLSDSDNELKLL